MVQGTLCPTKYEHRSRALPLWSVEVLVRRSGSPVAAWLGLGNGVVV